MGPSPDNNPTRNPHPSSTSASKSNAHASDAGRTAVAMTTSRGTEIFPPSMGMNARLEPQPNYDISEHSIDEDRSPAIGRFLQGAIIITEIGAGLIAWSSTTSFAEDSVAFGFLKIGIASGIVAGCILGWRAIKRDFFWD